MNTLIVEDDNMMRRILKRAAMALGHEVTGCVDAERALEMLAGGSKYTLVILDWMLPGMDGIELCKKIRSMPGGEHCFILMVTAKDRHEDLLEVLAAGADDYIAKPVDVKTLKTRLAVAMNMFERLEAFRDKA